MTSAFDGLPKLSDVIRSHGLAAKKSLGQNFLLDLQLTSKIARIGGPLEGATVIEVGPGPGGLTRALLHEGAAKVIAIERDDRCLAALADIADHYPGQLEVIAEDALTVDFAKIATPGARLIANLPYNIATVLLTGWLERDPWPPWWQSMTLMFQKEVANRIVAEPGDKAYGRLSVLVGWRAFATRLMDLPPSAFTPPPKVTSSIVHFEPKPDATPVDVTGLTTVTAAAFNQRRKMLRTSLKPIASSYPGGVEKLISETGLQPTQRAETVPVEAFLRIAQLLR